MCDTAPACLLVCRFGQSTNVKRYSRCWHVHHLHILKFRRPSYTLKSDVAFPIGFCFGPTWQARPPHGVDSASSGTWQTNRYMGGHLSNQIGVQASGDFHRVVLQRNFCAFFFFLMQFSPCRRHIHNAAESDHGQERELFHWPFPRASRSLLAHFQQFANHQSG